MGREARRVPANWSHPKDVRGYCKPLLDGDFEAAAARWKEGFFQWERGLRENWLAAKGEPKWIPRTADETGEWWEYNGNPPDRNSYMPKWADDERTHWQMYETTSEGTPISPVFSSAEELARWLANSGASAFGPMTATYEEWLATCLCGPAISAVIADGEITSGVAYQAELEKEREP